MRDILIILVVLLLIGGGIYYYVTRNNQPQNPAPTEQSTNVGQTSTNTPAQNASGTAETTNGQQTVKPSEVIGTSAGGNDITAYHYGTGDKEILFVGGIHGGYEWNTVLEAYQLMDYLQANPPAIPKNEMITVIPVLNPDGLKKVVGTTGRFTSADVPSTLDATIPGRFNANNVDLNRNFDCDWQAQGTWQNRTVSGGSAAFSEPESQAIQSYVNNHNLTAAVVWYSAAGGVFASNCHNGVLPETQTLTSLYAGASGYQEYESFDFYKITGDMVNWMAKENIPAISVLLTNHQDTEWDKNLKGIKAVLQHYAQ